MTQEAISPPRQPMIEEMTVRTFASETQAQRYPRG
jgi:hypothetical protein